ncbi:unnamed protein product [Phytomonas sp. EM1]|nr:unnamed protein product [Phytomonas sp. EM1]|eukprot:CCW62330.1 unnamed protein product [Phytomonas sp. isolate EM1]
MSVIDRSAGYRTAKDDAPPYDPSLWEGRDCAYITYLGRQLNDPVVRQRLAARASERGRQLASIASPHITTDTTPPLVRPPTLLEGAKGYGGLLWRWAISSLVRFATSLVPSGFRHPGIPSNVSLEELSSEELLTEMQMALASGHMERSTQIARELASRRVAFELRPVAADPNTPAMAPAQAKRADHLSAGYSGWISSAPPANADPFGRVNPPSSGGVSRDFSPFVRDARYELKAPIVGGYSSRAPSLPSLNSVIPSIDPPYRESNRHY